MVSTDGWVQSGDLSYLQMAQVSRLVLITQSLILGLYSDAQFNDITVGLSNSAPHVLDINTRASPPNFTITSLSNTVNSTNERSLIKDHFLTVQLHHPQNLNFALSTLATKILLCQPDDSDENPKAYGLQTAPNATLPTSDEFSGKVELDFTEYYARHEVIVSAGLFQSPQLVSRAACISDLLKLVQTTANGKTFRYTIEGD